jgi:MFS family permease
MNQKKRAWAVMMAAFLASIAVAVNAYKVPPVMRVLMADLGVGMVTGGWLMSAVSVASLILAIPSAFLLMRLGLKVTGMVALGCSVTGAIIGSQATGATTLLLARLIEGGGGALITVTASAAISAWFEPQDRGLPMGIWATWVPIGNVLIFNLAHPLLNAFGWQAVWWFGASFALLALLIYGLVVTEPPESEQHEQALPRSFGRMLFNPTSWLLALAWGTFAFSLVAYNTWAPAFLIETLSINPALANSYASTMFLAAIPANIIAGWLLGRLENRSRLLPVTFLITTVLFFWSFRLGSVSVVVPYMIALGFVSNFIPAASFTLAPETMPSLQFASLSLALLTVGSNSGSLTGPPVLGAILSTGNWTAGSICLVMVMGAGTMIGWLVSKRLRAT